MSTLSRDHGPGAGSIRYAAIALILGLAVFTASPGVALAEPGTDSGGSSSSSGASADSDKKDSPSTSGAKADTAASPTSPKDETNSTTPKAESSSTTGTSGTTDASPTTDPDSATEADEAPVTEPGDAATVPTEPESPAAQPAETEAPEPAAPVTPEAPTDPPADPSTTPAADTKNAKPVDTAVTVAALPTPGSAELDTVAKDPEPEPEVADVAPSAARISALTVAAPVAAALVEPQPQPVSPIAQLAALPGRIVNAVLQLFGFTTSASAGQSPISPAPIADLFFAVFRRIEEALGLHAPVVQPVPPTMVYDGPVDRPTPTVAQFLNASSAEYVLGGTPAGMVPFTVTGWPLTALHLETGSDASVWVTPENQIIIAYSGTTGGTHLLFNPLIAITQIITDLEAGLGSTTPLAFTQAVDFAERVKAEAALQGYSTDDIFVTGHSLGAWQAQYVAQQIGLAGIGFEGPGLNSTVPGNGADSLFVNVATYGDMAGFLSSDLPGLNPIAPPYVPGGGAKPHYGPIVLLGDPAANTPMVNAANLFGKGIIGTLISGIDLLGNFFAKHLPGVQAYHLDVDLDPGVVPWLGINEGPVYTGFGELTIQEFLKAASDKGILIAP